MVQLIYASAAIKPFTAEDLRGLLEKAKLRNGQLEISGMLLYHTGSFLQVLEGTASNVDLVFQSIERDVRHHKTKVLLRHETVDREFGDWSMGFANSGLSQARPQGWVDYSRVLPGLGDASTRARSFLRFFQSGLHRQ